MSLGARAVLCAVLALASALAFAVATVGQQRAAASHPQGSFVAQLVRDRLWLASTAGTMLGYALQAAALAFGPVLLVQPIIVLSLLFALPLSARLHHARLPRHVFVAAVALVAALVVVVLIVDGDRGLSRADPHSWTVAVPVLAVLCASCLAAGRARSGDVRAALVSVVVGLLAGVVTVLTKAVVVALEHGVGSLVRLPETWALVAVGLGGYYLQQLAFRAGSLRASMPVIAVVEPVASAILGIVLLAEHIAAGGLELAALVLAALVLVVATVVVARTNAAIGPPA